VLDVFATVLSSVPKTTEPINVASEKASPAVPLLKANMRLVSTRTRLSPSAAPAAVLSAACCATPTTTPAEAVEYGTTQPTGRELSAQRALENFRRRFDGEIEAKRAGPADRVDNRVTG
jgi:hypothetical protein